MTLSDPMDCSLPGFSVYGIFQARVLESGATVSLLLPVYSQEAGKKLCPEPPTGTDRKLQAEYTVLPSQRVRKRVA